MISTSKENIRSNLILYQYEDVIQALRQYQFPFANIRIEIIEIPTDIQAINTTYLIRKINDYIYHLRIQIKLSNIPFDEHDKDIIVNTFYSFSNSFYMWHDNNIRYEMENFLAGKEIFIKADITNGLDINALRFNEIRIRFQLSDENAQNEFDNLLEQFHLRMTIIGNNYLRCDSRFYYVSLDNDIAIEYSFKNASDGKPSRVNDMYRKIIERPFFFIPFIMWKIQLISVDPESLYMQQSFNKLAKFTNISIDLRLIGRGQYYKHKELHSFAICNEQMDEFYQLDIITSFMNKYLFEYKHFE